MVYKEMDILINNQMIDKVKLKEQLSAFIVKAVTENLVFSINGLGVATLKVTIQQLINETQDKTLALFYEWLRKQPVNSGSKLLQDESTRKYIAGTVTAEELAEIVDIIRFFRKEASEANKSIRRVAEIKEKLQALETPDETRKRLQEELEAIEGKPKE